MDTEPNNDGMGGANRWFRTQHTSSLKLEDNKIHFAQVAALEIERHLSLMLASLGVDIKVRIHWQHELDEAGKAIQDAGFFKILGDTSIQPPTNHGPLG